MLGQYYHTASPLLQAIQQPYATNNPNVAFQPNYELFWLDQPGAAWPSQPHAGIVGQEVINQMSPEEFAAAVAPYLQELQGMLKSRSTGGMLGANQVTVDNTQQGPPVAFPYEPPALQPVEAGPVRSAGVPLAGATPTAMVASALQTGIEREGSLAKLLGSAK